MDRLNGLHDGSRVELPTSVETAGSTSAQRGPWLRPVTLHYLGILGFVSCSAVVIVVAGLIAMEIH